MYSAYMKKQQNSKSLSPLSVHYLFIKKIQCFKCLQEFLDVNKPGNRPAESKPVQRLYRKAVVIPD